MAVFKCKMCSGTLELEGNESVAVCEYCGTKQTLPRLEDEKRANLYDRANHFRRNNEFDKAMGMYEQILNEDTTDSEAYWSLVLCRYGIEYVEDPATHKRVPTVNRAQFTSILVDEDYKAALQYADSYQKEVYEAEAVAIDKIQKGILEISQKEEPFDVFICYKETESNGCRTQDSVLANDLYHQLTQEGFKVFFARITLEDKLGSAYEPYIFAALNSAKVMVVLGTRPEFFTAVWVKNEWSRYLGLIKNGAKKVLIPAYRDMDPYDLPEEFSHLQAQDMSKLGFMQDLIRGIKKLTAVEEKVVEKQVIVNNAGEGTAPLLKRAFLFLEDADWDSANDYCEKVLDIDPECAKAYVGKLLADLKLRRESDIVDFEDTAAITNHTHYQKACRFADDKYRAVLEGYITENIKKKEQKKKEEIYKAAMDSVTAAQTSKRKDYYEIYLQAAEQFEKISGYKDADTKRQECLESWKQERNNAIYRDATALISDISPKTPGNIKRNLYLEAVALFESILEYKDSDEKKKLCLEKAEEFRKEDLYEYALSNENDYNNATEEAQINHLKIAIENYQKIPGYKDSDERKEQCEKKIEHLQAQKIKKDRQRKAKTKKMGIIAGVAVVATILVWAASYFFIIPAMKYSSALKLMKGMQYEEAHAAFAEVSDYKDSKEKRAVIEAVYELQKGNEVQAIRQLLVCGTSVRLEYNADGGTQEVSSCVYKSLDEFSKLQTVVKDGYFFEGWKCENFQYNIKENEIVLNLTAVWVMQTYEISYVLKDTKVENDNITSYNINTGSFVLKHPVREGYIFAGWTGVGIDEPSLEVIIPSENYCDKVFTAHWNPMQYKVTLDANGGDIVDTVLEVTYGEAYSLPIPEREYYVFEGWFAGDKKVTSKTWDIAKNEVLTAKWSPLEYKIEYNFNGVEATNPNASSFTVETPDIELGAACATGYKFLGWYSDEKCTEIIEKISPKKLLEPITVYAKWEEIVYTITYDLNGGQSKENLVLEYTVKDLPLSLPKASKVHCEFSGWSDTPSGSHLINEITEVRNYELKAYYVTKGLEFTISSTYCILSGYSGTQSKLEIPAVYIKDGVRYPVREIGEEAFQGNKTIKSVVVPEGVTTIGSWAFSASTLEEIELPDTLENIGHNVFRGCDKLVKLVIPKNVGEIGIWILMNCENLKELTIPDGSMPLEDYFGFGCVIILDKLTISGGTYICSDFNSRSDGCRVREVFLPDSILEIGSGAFYNVDSIEMPDKVQSIGDGAFGYGRFTNINLPDSVKTIGAAAFEDCNLLVSINVPSKVTVIEKKTFAWCESLKEVTLPDGLVEIGERAFEGCDSLDKIKLSSNITSIANNAIPSDTIIIAEKGSYAEAYAVENGHAVEYYE